jgi:type II secretory pathway predicted ATPase ExeA
MYEEFYGFSQTPFSKTPDPAFLYLSKGHEEALARLQYGVEQKELILLTGEVGCGKTTITRALIDSLDDNQRVVLILNPRLSPAQLLKTIARRLEIDVTSKFKDDLLESINEKVYNLYEEDITPVIIIDEAQLIPKKETFEEVRLLTNFQLDDTNLLSLILVGQPGLKKRLGHRTYRALKQRIGLFYSLGPLSEDETLEYVRFRLKVGGRDNSLFTDDALSLIHKYSEGVPRLINSIATAALLDGLGKEIDHIGSELIEDAAKELMLN